MSVLEQSSIGIDDYLQDGETVYARTETTRVDRSDQTQGTLAVTDSRVVFVDGSSASDIALEAVDEQVYHPRYVPWEFVAGAALVATLSLVALFFDPVIELFGSDMQTFLTVGGALGLIVTIGLAAGAIGGTGARLHLTTPQSTYRFKGGDLTGIPHAIRGAADR